ncbi:MAG: flagellar filament capping protein FliD [Lachnospiraceae bacterium]|nr:flagellar filament capping protein FliD [Lachnospiraceae bacterium]
MSDLLRMTGMYSGMDTDTVIQQLVKAKAQKVTNLKNDQKKLEWKQSIWQDLNKRIYKLYSNTLSNMRLAGSYAKKKTKVSDPTKAVITAGDGAVNGSQSLEVLKTAKGGYLTGAAVSKKSSGYVPIYDKDAATDGSETTLADLGVGDGTLTVNITGGGSFTVNADSSKSVDDFINEFNTAASSAGANISMSYNEGKITVDGPAGGYEMSSSGIASGAKKTILQGLGLNNTCAVGDGAAGKVEGAAIEKFGTIYEAGKFKNHSTGDAEKDRGYNFLVSDIASDLVGKKLKLTVGKGEDAKVTYVEITADMEIGELTDKLSQGGVNASFDEGNQRFFISAAKTGAANDFTLEGEDASGNSDASVLNNLGLAVGNYGNGSSCTRIDGSDAEIKLNGATFTSDTNTFTVNGLSITAQVETEEPITITTDTDYDGIYDMIKDFITEYNDIMNEVTKLYNANSARKYSMLSDEEKEAMSDDEVEKWESTIKDSLLRKDKDLYSVMDCMRGAVNKGYEVNGKTLYLVNFGIGTGSYFDTEKAERNALHIFGDSDDDKYSDKENELKAAIAENPEDLIGLFTAMSTDMYNSLKKTMGSTEYRSIYKVYDDKRMKTEYDDYTKKIKEAQKKLDAYEDKWYKKFSAMEVALSKLQSSQNSLASMLGQ